MRGLDACLHLRSQTQVDEGFSDVVDDYENSVGEASKGQQCQAMSACG